MQLPPGRAHGAPQASHSASFALSADVGDGEPPDDTAAATVDARACTCACVVSDTPCSVVPAP